MHRRGECHPWRRTDRPELDAPGFDGGSPVTGYEYSLDGGDTWTLLDSSGTDPVTGSVLNLDNGTEYTASVRALNAEGPSAASVAGQAVPARVPDAPTGVSATRGDVRPR